MVMRKKQVTVEVTNQGAVYVDNHRITGRETKWGVHHTIFAIKVNKDDVAKALHEHGYGHIKLEYLSDLYE
jgi:biopolymer transport protein ExbD